MQTGQWYITVSQVFALRTFLRADLCLNVKVDSEYDQVRDHI